LLSYSRQYGFLKLNAPENAKKKELVVKVITISEPLLEHSKAKIKNV
jgi:hypothetical protein